MARTADSDPGRAARAGAAGRGAAPLPEGPQLGSSLQGQLLIASPQIGDPRFSHSVILLVRHDRSGALGIIINRPFEERTLASLLAAIGKPDDTVDGKIRVRRRSGRDRRRLHSAQRRISSSRHDLDRRPDRHELGAGAAERPRPSQGTGQGLVRDRLCRLGARPARKRDRAQGLVHAPADPKFVFDDDRELLWEHAMARRTRDL
ncbi:MAG: YqgE/AlgH family protein [Pseudomonadota bacterium]